MRVTVAGHASVLVETAGARVLVDPVFDDGYASGSMAFVPARAFDRDALPPLSALVITHAHLDHFHPPTLRALPTSLRVFVPPDPRLERWLGDMGFADVVTIREGERVQVGDLGLEATPSDFETPELGLLFASGGRSFWHMSDSVVTEATGLRLRAAYGPLDAVAARFQPVQVLPGYLRGLGSSFDERAGVVEWMETACLTEPRFVFPYAWAVAFTGRHAWANRYLGPWTAEEAAHIYRRRLPGASVEVLRPGDILELEAAGPRVRRAAASWVREVPSPPVDPWEPIDAATLAGVTPSERPELEARLDAVLDSELAPLLAAALASGPNLFHNFRRWQVVYQLVVHAGPAPGGRIERWLDFRADEPPRWRRGLHPEANLFGHLSGEGLLRVLRGEAGTELFWMSGDVRQYERIIYLEDGRLKAPPMSGWALFDQLPELVSFYLRRLRA